MVGEQIDFISQLATGWRREMHRQPGLAFQEIFAHRLVAEKLIEWRIPFHVLGRTGIVGIINGNNPGKTIGLRADMDALPIEENKTGKSWASINPGIMHACGHDGHTAILLGTAQYLNQNRDFDGRVLLIFQPAEENASFGAKAMIKDGLFSDNLCCDEVYTIHNSPAYPLGSALTCAGPMMASSDNFLLTVIGKGGHAAFMDDTINPIESATRIAMYALDRGHKKWMEPDLNQKAVINIAGINAGGDSFNITPGTATIRGTLRTFNPGVREFLKRDLSEIWSNIAAHNAAQINIEWKTGYDSTINAPVPTQKAVVALKEAFDAEYVNEYVKPIMAVDDFGAMSSVVPGCYVTLGQATQDKNSAANQNLHSAGYDFNDDLIAPAIKYFTSLVQGPKPA